MTELELQSEYVMDFFCRRADGLGFREIKNNAVSPDLFIPANLYEFLKENSRKAWNNLLKKSEYNGDEQKLLRAIMDMIREKIEASANVAIFLNKNRTITFEGETLQLIYVSGSELRGDEDFNKNILCGRRGDELFIPPRRQKDIRISSRPVVLCQRNFSRLCRVEEQLHQSDRLKRTAGTKSLPITSKPYGNIPRLPVAMMYRKRFVVVCSDRLRNRFTS